MKKFWSLLLLLATSTAAYALPVGNPLDASLLCDGVFCEGHCGDHCDPNLRWCDAWSWRIGFYGDYVFDRHLKVDSREDSSTIHESELYTNAVYLAFNLYDRIDLFGTLGTTEFSFNGYPVKVAALNHFVFDAETYFSWSVGLRGTIWECGNFGFGGEVQYFHTRPHINSMRDENAAPVYPAQGARINYKEWQMGIGVGYQHYIASCATSLVPYAAIKWGHTWVDNGDILFNNPIVSLDEFSVPNLRNARDFGYAIGLTLVGCDKASVTVEARYLDETAVHVNTQYRF